MAETNNILSVLEGCLIFDLLIFDLLIFDLIKT